MNRPPHRPSSDHVTDEILSAFADGVLAADDAALVENHLGECPDCSARLAAFDAVRAALRRSTVEPVAPVDEVTRRRMISAALNAPGAARAARGSGPTARYRALAVAAVAVLAVAAVATLRVTGGDESQLASGTAETFGLPIGPERVRITDGALDDPDALAAALAAAEASTSAYASGDEQSGEVYDNVAGDAAGERRAGGSTGGGAAIISDGAVAQTGESDVAGSGTATSSIPAPAPLRPAPQTVIRSATPDELRAIARCYRTVKGSATGGGTLTSAVTGTYQNAPVIVLGFRSPDKRTLAMILARDSCTIVSAQSFR